MALLWSLTAFRLVMRVYQLANVLIDLKSICPTVAFSRAADVEDSYAGSTRWKYTNLRQGEALALAERGRVHAVWGGPRWVVVLAKPLAQRKTLTAAECPMCQSRHLPERQFAPSWSLRNCSYWFRSWVNAFRSELAFLLNAQSL